MAQPDVGVEIIGLAELTRTLRKAGEDISELKEAHRAAGEIVASYASSIAPRRSGRLASSIRPMKQARRARVVAGRASVPYAQPIHWGWAARGIKGQPFLSDAARATEGQWLPKYLADVEAALERVVGA